MRHLLSVISVLAVLVAVVAGCGRGASYDGRLVAADSLMRDCPDSALAVVEGVCRDSLAAEGDRAYRDLLLTQARYRCYITATSDSDINRALAYYRSHPNEQEKLTRAHIYKGAVMEELGHPDSAMLHYKHAEATAAPDDYFNLGYVNTRIAALYRKYYADKEICFQKYEKALKYHKKTGNKRLQQNCYFNMAGCMGITKRDEPDKYFKQALGLAKELNDSLLICECLELYLRQLSIDSTKRRQAKHIAFDVLQNYPKYVNIDLILDLAYIYANDGDIDSARYYLNIVSNSPVTDHNGQIQSRRNSILAIIARSDKDPTNGVFFTSQNKKIEDSLLNNKYRYFIQHLENTNNEIQNQNTKHEISTLQLTINIVASVFIAVIIVFLVSFIQRKKHIKSLMRELETINVNNHESILEQIEEKDSVIGKLVKNMVEFMQQSIETTEHDSPRVIRKKIKETIIDVADDNFWRELSRFIDNNHNNLISNLKQQYPKLTEKDIRFIELTCCGFSYLEIAIILDYTTKYISQKRKEIAKKMNLSISLQEYIEKSMKEIKT